MSLRRMMRNARRAVNYEIGRPSWQSQTMKASDTAILEHYILGSDSDRPTGPDVFPVDMTVTVGANDGNEA